MLYKATEHQSWLGNMPVMAVIITDAPLWLTWVPCLDLAMTKVAVTRFDWLLASRAAGAVL